MALHWIEGFEVDGTVTYLTAKYASVGSSPTTSTPGRSGSGRFMQGTNATLTTPSFGVQNTWVTGFGSYLASNTSAQGVRFLTGATEQFRIETQNSGTGYVWRALRGAAVLATGTTVLPINAWAFIEVKVTVRSGTNGAVELRINEATEFTVAGINTANSGGDGADVIVLVNGASASNRLDDIYIMDDTGSAPHNDFLGDSIVHGILPTSDGALSEWGTAGAGASHAARVDDPPTAADDNDRIISDTTGHRDLFNMANLPTITGTIRGIQVNVRAAMATAGVRDIRALFRDAAGPTLHDVGAADATVNGTTHRAPQFIQALNPLTGLAWTQSDIDTNQFGVEVKA